MSSHIEIEGNLPEDPALAYSEAGTPWTRFKVIVNDRIKQQDDTYANGPAVTYWVKAFRNLAENVANSLAKRDPILVTGELTISEYRDSEGVIRIAREIMARRVAVPLTHRVVHLAPKLTSAESGVIRRA